MDWHGFKTGLKASLISSSCCSLPIALILLFSTVGAANMTAALRLPKYKTVFWMLGFMFLGASIYLTVKKRCDGTCNIKSIKKESRYVLASLITYIVMSFTIIYHILPAISELIFGG